MNQCTSVGSAVMAENPVGLSSLDDQMVGKGILGMGNEKGVGGFQEAAFALNLQRQSVERRPRQRKLQEQRYMGHEYLMSLHQTVPWSQGLIQGHDGN